MSKRARLGGRLECWMVDDDVAASQGVRSKSGDSARAAALPRPFLRAIEDMPPSEAGPVAIDEGGG